MLPPPTTSSTSPSTTVASTTSSTVERAFAPELGDLDGTIAVTGASGMAFVAPTGELIAEYALGTMASQPTWSRDGSSLIATVVDPFGSVQVITVDASTLESERQPAVRPYFFYSWSPDGSVIAALGPGPGGTVLDLLSSDGEPRATEVATGTSVYLAWSPDNSSLVVHQDQDLVWLPDPITPGSAIDLEASGTSYLAPAWVPGTDSVLVVTGGELVSVDVVTGDSTSFGPVRGTVEVAPSPDGSFAVVAQSPDPSEPTASTVEVIDLSTGERSSLSSEPSFWLEWSPSGEELLFASVLDGIAAWFVWDGASPPRSVERWVPSDDFGRNYLRFAPQYTESPRLWSPDGRAIVYGAELEGSSAVVVLPLDGRDRVGIIGALAGFWGAGERPRPVA